MGLTIHIITMTCVVKCNPHNWHTIDSFKSVQNTKFINKRGFNPKIYLTLKKLLINITGNHYRLIAVKLHFQNIFSECFMNNFPTKNTNIKYNNRLPYITSGLHSQSSLNIPLDMLRSKIQLMKINRNVEHSITN